MKREEVLRLINIERERQEALYGPQDNRTNLEWLAILSEEFGEVSKEVNDIYFKNKDTDDYCIELVQLAAVCVAVLEKISDK